MNEFPTHRAPYFPTHAIRDLRHPAIRCEEKAIFFVMADRQQNPSDLVTASLGTIADDAGVSRKTAQRVVSWAVSVGIISQHIRDGFRCYSFHLDQLVALPTSSVRDRLRAGTRGPIDESRGPIGGTGGPIQSRAPMGPAVPSMGPRVHVQCPAVPCSVSGGPPKDQTRTKQGPNEGANSARVPRRSEGAAGGNLGLDFGPAIPATPEPIPAMEAPRPERPETVVDTLPVPSQIPLVKANVRAKPKRASRATEPRTSVLSPEQAHAHTTAIDCWHNTFIENKNGEKPIITGKDIKDIDRLLALVQWDCDKACALIRNAFTYVWFREKQCSVATILKQPSMYQVPAQTGPVRVSSGQSEPDENFWTGRDYELTKEFGT